LGLIATRSVNTQIPGITALVTHAEERIRSGMVAYEALEKLKTDPGNTGARADLESHFHDLGYALLLKRYAPNVLDATPDQVKKASWDTVPTVAALFWSFRFMAGIGFFFIALFATAFLFASWRRFDVPWFLRLCIVSLPLPWLAAELGWIVAEHGRQPWAIEGILPTYLSVSSVSAGQVWMSLAGFVLFYSVLAVADAYLMAKYARLGPDGLSAKKAEPTPPAGPAMKLGTIKGGK